MTPPDARLAQALDSLTTRVVQRVAELPDRTSPDDWPEMMLVTARELEAIVGDAVSALLADVQIAQQQEVAKWKARCESLANFNPDWDMLEATQASLREHMQLLRQAQAELAALLAAPAAKTDP